MAKANKLSGAKLAAKQADTLWRFQGYILISSISNTWRTILQRWQMKYKCRILNSEIYTVRKLALRPLTHPRYACKILVYSSSIQTMTGSRHEKAERNDRGRKCNSSYYIYLKFVQFPRAFSCHTIDGIQFHSRSVLIKIVTMQLSCFCVLCGNVLHSYI